MNRGDARLVVMVLVTAIAASAATALITARLSATTSTDDHLQRLDERISLLELRLELQAKDAALQPMLGSTFGTQAPQPPLVLTPIAQPDPTPCDEVSCVLNNYEAACCARYGHPSALTHDGLADSLDRAMISDGITKIKASVLACGDKRPTAKGKVSVSVRVSPDGTIARVTINDTPDAALGDCVKEAVTRATFATTHDGGSFRYPFVF